MTWGLRGDVEGPMGVVGVLGAAWGSHGWHRSPMGDLRVPGVIQGPMGVLRVPGAVWGSHG